AAAPETPAHTASLTTTLTNVNTMVASIQPEQTAIGISGVNAGLLWWGGDLTIQALPVIYTGQQIASSVITVVAAGTGSTGTVTRTLTSAPFETTLSGSNSITSGNNAAASNRGVGNIEDPVLTVNLTSITTDGQPGPQLLGLAGPGGQPIRLDNFAPVVSDFDRALLYSQSYPMSRWVG